MRNKQKEITDAAVVPRNKRGKRKPIIKKADAVVIPRKKQTLWLYPEETNRKTYAVVIPRKNKTNEQTRKQTLLLYPGKQNEKRKKETQTSTTK